MTPKRKRKLVYSTKWSHEKNKELLPEPILVQNVRSVIQQREQILQEKYGGSEWLMDYCTKYGTKIY